MHALHVVWISFCAVECVGQDFMHLSAYDEPQDMGVPEFLPPVPTYFERLPHSDAPVMVYSSGYRVEQAFHSPLRSYGFGVEERRVLERSHGLQQHIGEPIIVRRPFEGTLKVYPLSGRIVQYGPLAELDQPFPPFYQREQAPAVPAFRREYPFERGLEEP